MYFISLAFILLSNEIEGAKGPPFNMGILGVPGVPGILGLRIVMYLWYVFHMW